MTKIKIDNKSYLISVKSKDIKLLAKWRKENMFAFPTQFKVTLEGTGIWLDSLMKSKERVLFMIYSRGISIGHIGLNKIKKDSCELDNVVRGVKKGHKGIMALAVKTLINYAQKSKITLRVFSDNIHAVSFYERCGFVKLKDIPLIKVVEGDRIEYKPAYGYHREKIEKFFTEMVKKQ